MDFGETRFGPQHSVYRKPTHSHGKHGPCPQSPGHRDPGCSSSWSERLCVPPAPISPGLCSLQEASPRTGTGTGTGTRTQVSLGFNARLPLLSLRSLRTRQSVVSVPSPLCQRPCVPPPNPLTACETKESKAARAASAIFSAPPTP